MARSHHVSYYVNVPQTVGILVGGICIWRWIKMEEAKALHFNRSFLDICREDLTRLGIIK